MNYFHIRKILLCSISKENFFLKEERLYLSPKLVKEFCSKNKFLPRIKVVKNIEEVIGELKYRRGKVMDIKSIIREELNLRDISFSEKKISNLAKEIFAKNSPLGRARIEVKNILLSFEISIEFKKSRTISDVVETKRISREIDIKLNC